MSVSFFHSRIFLIFALFILMVSLSWSVSAQAQEGELSAGGSFEERSSYGLVTLVGPQLGLHGPPSAFKIEEQFWHAFDSHFAFHAGVAMTFAGETTIEGDGAIPNAAYSSMVGTEVSAGLRIMLDLGSLPFDVFSRAALAFEFMSADELVGYYFAPALGGGIIYPLGEHLDFVAELETTGGYGLFQGSGSVFAWTLDALVGAQVHF